MGRSVAPPLALLRRYQLAVTGSKTPMPSWPVPVQSPTTGFQPAPPKLNVVVGAPPLALSRRYQLPVLGSKAPMPSWPVWFQSPTTGIQPAPPKLNFRSGAPPLSE